jgi:hypothetical protein
LTTSQYVVVGGRVQEGIYGIPPILVGLILKCILGNVYPRSEWGVLFKNAPSKMCQFEWGL